MGDFIFKAQKCGGLKERIEKGAQGEREGGWWAVVFGGGGVPGCVKI